MGPNQYVRSGPLSFCQELLLSTEVHEWVAPTISRLVQISGQLNTSAFAAAAQAMIAAHEPLRSIHIWRSGEPLCQVLAPGEIEGCFQYDDATCDTSARSALKFAYDPAGFAAARAPQMRHGIVRAAEATYLWAFGVHHIAADAISLRYYAETFCERYAGASSNRQPTGSIDHALVQRNWLRSAKAQIEYEWWLRQLDTIHPQALPVRPPGSPSVTGQRRQELRVAVGRNSVARRARDWRVPAAALFFAAFARAVAGRCATSEVAVFTNVPGRSLPGASKTTGAFYNSLPLVLRAQTGDAQSASSMTAETLYEVLDHQEVPVALLSLGASRRGAVPLAARIPITFNIVDHPLGSFRMPGCRLHEVDIATLERVTWGSGEATLLQGAPISQHSTMDWLITVLPSALTIAVEYDAAQCDPDEVRELLESYGAELRAFVGSDFGDEGGDPSLVADWSSP